jgi:hypothetical protein
MTRWIAVVLLGLVGGCAKEPAEASGGEPRGDGPGGAVTAGSMEREEPAPPPEPTFADRMGEAGTFAEALALALPEMEDGRDETSLGALGLAFWASTRLRFDDVAVARDETSPKLILKDPDRERGKRMCVRGRIVQIAKQDLGRTAVFEGLLMMSSGQIVHYIAAGDTGTLVEGDRGRLCGVTSGRYSYSNAGGGTTHAVQLVGMFDLPSNRGGAARSR